MALAIPPSSPRSIQAINAVSPALKRALKKQQLHFGSPIYIRIFKEESLLEIWIKQTDHFKLFKTYPICDFSGQLGPKEKMGDNQAPEGFYFVKPTQLNPYSRFHLSFNLGYPNRYDRALNRTGSALMVHGNCVSIGCYAMTDQFIEEIYALADAALRQGQPFFRVHIFPFKMTRANLQQHQKSKWKAFWLNLKQGYDWFYQHHQNPPNVEVKNKQYVFSR